MDSDKKTNMRECKAMLTRSWIQRSAGMHSNELQNIRCHPIHDEDHIAHDIRTFGFAFLSISHKDREVLQPWRQAMQDLLLNTPEKQLKHTFEQVMHYVYVS